MRFVTEWIGTAKDWIVEPEPDAADLKKGTPDSKSKAQPSPPSGLLLARPGRPSSSVSRQPRNGEALPNSKTVLAFTALSALATRGLAQPFVANGEISADSPPEGTVFTTPRHVHLEQTLFPQCLPQAVANPVGKLPPDGDTASAMFASIADVTRILLPGRVPSDPAPTDARYRDIAPLMAYYQGEETGAVFGSPVAYLNAEERASLRVTIKDGRLYNVAGQQVDTQRARTAHGNAGRAIFVMSYDGEVYVSCNHKPGQFHHSSFLAGKPVAAAGEIQVEHGEVKLVNRMSGHYQPTAEQLNQFVDHLHAQGVHDFTVIQGLDTTGAGRPGSMQWLRNVIMLTGAGIMAAQKIAHAQRRRLDQKLGQLSPDALTLVRIVALRGPRFDSEVTRTAMGLSEAQMNALVEELSRANLFGAEFAENDRVVSHIRDSIPDDERAKLRVLMRLIFDGDRPHRGRRACEKR
ncbi:hypothetical protein [Paraburkholderia sp. CI3]|uniref:hypothetical protein n=1 Tax=Paraburkholderia sp. CI3 TaxID=2991060 RepID=UPI003D19823D